jgi:hypothetical protein
VFCPRCSQRAGDPGVDDAFIGKIKNLRAAEDEEVFKKEE